MQVFLKGNAKQLVHDTFFILFLLNTGIRICPVVLFLCVLLPFLSTRLPPSTAFFFSPFLPSPFAQFTCLEFAPSCLFLLQATILFVILHSVSENYDACTFLVIWYVCVFTILILITVLCIVMSNSLPLKVTKFHSLSCSGSSRNFFQDVPQQA